jgi:hypothetical protein
MNMVQLSAALHASHCYPINRLEIKAGRGGVKKVGGKIGLHRKHVIVMPFRKGAPVA